MSMSTQTADVAAWLTSLEEARKAATPGPWQVDDDGEELRVAAGTARVEWKDYDGFRLGTPPSSYRSTDLIHEHDIGEWSGETEEDVEQRQADAALIVAAVNSMRELVAALRGALALHRPEPGPYGDVCASCLGSNEENLPWPCPTYSAVVAAAHTEEA